MGNAAAVLTITKGDDSTFLNIKLPEGVVPDATDSRVTKQGDVGFQIKSDETGVFSIVLLKKNKSIDLHTEGSVPFADQIEITIMP